MNILLIVVLYNKNINELNFLKDLVDENILIFDNSLKAQEVNGNFLYIHEPQNVGVSAAYNKGISIARNKGHNAVILLDQDTEFDAFILKKYKEALNIYGDEYIYAPKIVGKDKVYSPYIEKDFRNVPCKVIDFRDAGVFELRNRSLINSGLMIPIKVINNIGEYNPLIKLDFSDTYFIEKYKMKYLEIILLEISIQHSLSGDEGYNPERELHRFEYFCEGAFEYKKNSFFKKRITKLVYYRTVRLMYKYRTLQPLIIMKKKYLKVGNNL